MLEVAVAEGQVAPFAAERSQFAPAQDIGRVYVLGRGGLDLGATVEALNEAGYFAVPLHDPAVCLDLVAARLPNAIVVDVGERRGEGLDVVRCLKAWHCPSPILVASPASDVRTAVEAMKIGARDVLELPVGTADIVERLREAIHGPAAPPSLDSLPLSPFPGHEMLTRRELQVLSYVAAGSSNKEAGRLLGISPRTVEVHRARAMEKLGARNAADLVRIILSET